MRNLLLIGLLAGLTGCGVVTPLTRSQKKLNRLTMGETHRQVVDILGTPDNIAHAETLADGRQIQVDEYRMHDPTQAALNLLLCPITLTVTCWTPALGDRFYRQYYLGYTNGKLTHISKDKNDPMTVNLR